MADMTRVSISLPLCLNVFVCVLDDCIDYTRCGNTETPVCQPDKSSSLRTVLTDFVFISIFSGRPSFLRLVSNWPHPYIYSPPPTTFPLWTRRQRWQRRRTMSCLWRLVFIWFPRTWRTFAAHWWHVHVTEWEEGEKILELAVKVSMVKLAWLTLSSLLLSNFFCCQPCLNDSVKKFFSFTLLFFSSLMFQMFPFWLLFILNGFKKPEFRPWCINFAESCTTTTASHFFNGPERYFWK